MRRVNEEGASSEIKSIKLRYYSLDEKKNNNKARDLLVISVRRGIS
jgi:hypothetical protein